MYVPLRDVKRLGCWITVPRKIISDNSKTFVSSSKMLTDLSNHPEVETFLADQRVKWSFNLEKAPWWGGFFERLIGMTKRCLKKVIGRAKLTCDELLTEITEIEANLNSRPLTYVGSGGATYTCTFAYWSSFNSIIRPLHSR